MEQAAALARARPIRMHELRTPLNSIAGYAELLEIGIHGPLNDSQREAIARIPRSERHLLGLINDVLNFALRRRRQILLNLLSNAIKLTEPGRLIAVSADSEDGVVRLRVRDGGTGILADKLHPIFEPFVQLQPGRTRTHEGTGLGLAISRELARAMHGGIAVESSVGVGSTFTLTLPRSRL